MTPEQTDKVRELNDAFRTNPYGDGGRTLITAAASNKGLVFTLKLQRAAREFSDFNASNDPHGEHDMAIFQADGETCFFKIDYYASGDMDYGSEAPWDHDATCRVMTLGLMSDY